jgi:hypothetical protein
MAYDVFFWKDSLYLPTEVGRYKLQNSIRLDKTLQIQNHDN